MKIDLVLDDLHLSDADEVVITSRLELALASRRPAIESVAVWLCDLPGFEPDLIKHCRIEIKLVDGRTVIADSCDVDFEVVIERAAMRAGKNLAAAGGRQTRCFEPVPARRFGNVGRPATSYLENTA